MAKKTRVDQLLVEQGLFPTRSRAQAALMAGIIYLNGQRIDKAGTPVPEDSPLEVRGKDCPYVSRGGLKLARALDVFEWDVTGLKAIDLGSSTGGFCDCLLQRGAAHVVAVDVGKHQLDIKLRTDERVTVMEETNARHLQRDDVPYQAEFLSADLSFISLALLFPAMRQVGLENARAACLIKPQFECGPKFLRKGVCREPEVHFDVLKAVLAKAHEAGLETLHITHSPVKGPAGNIEFLAGFRLQPDNQAPQGDPPDWDSRLKQAVETAHRELNPS